MAVLSGGTWSDTAISSVVPSGSGTYQTGAVTCPAAGQCLVGLLPPATSSAGFVPYDDGVWGDARSLGTRSPKPW